MENIWIKTLEKLNVPKEISDRWWQKIIEQYSEETRIYHNVNKYLKRKVETYEEMVESNISDHCVFVLAMFFQHYEYETNVYGGSLDKNVEHLKAFFKDAGITYVTYFESIISLIYYIY